MSELTIIIQARMGSTRFPGKVVADLNGEPVLRHVIRRCASIRSDGQALGKGRIVIAAPKEGSEKIAALVNSLGWPIYFGPENDVLERYWLASQEFAADQIMRITGDCPMLDPKLCNDTLRLFEAGGCSYAGIGEGRTFPKGYGCEVFSQFTLRLANEMATDPYDREHVTPWMERNVRCKYLTQDKDESHLNYCVDVPEDIPRLEKILARNES